MELDLKYTIGKKSYNSRVAMYWRPEGRRKAWQSRNKWRRTANKIKKQWGNGRAGPKPDRQSRTDLNRETELQPYVPHGIERTRLLDEMLR